MKEATLHGMRVVAFQSGPEVFKVILTLDPQTYEHHELKRKFGVVDEGIALARGLLMLQEYQQARESAHEELVTELASEHPVAAWSKATFAVNGAGTCQMV